MSTNMAFDTPSSSMLSRVAYNPEHHVLSLTFRQGGTHHFADVPVIHYHGMQAAKSVGSYYHGNIKGTFKSSK
jgi:hypothetical protein